LNEPAGGPAKEDKPARGGQPEITMSDMRKTSKPVGPAKSPGPPVDDANTSVMEDRARPRRMLKLEQVLQLVPVSDVTLWRMERDGLFPKGDFISYNTKVWYEDEIIQWQNSTSGRTRGRRPRKPRKP
jgi:predicted DNA-binding transcriptional regulator AlpA